MSLFLYGMLASWCDVYYLYRRTVFRIPLREKIFHHSVFINTPVVSKKQ